MVNTVSYKLATVAGYKSNIVKMGQESYDPLAYYYKGNFPDVELTRPNTDTDLKLLHNKTLITVNGFIYPTAYSDRRLYIPNATTSMLKSKLNSIGILSFNKHSKPLNKITITADMITPEAPTGLFEKAIITFDRPIGNAFLVLAGYMVFEQPEYFYRVSDRSFVVRLDKLNYIERLYELSYYRNIFDELGIEVSPNNPFVMDALVARSDPVITKLLTLFNTFLVEVPDASLTRRKIYLEHSHVPGNFRTELEPSLPLVSGYGKLSEYTVKKNNDTKYTVYINDGYMNKFLFSKLSTSEINIYNNHRVPGNPYELSPAFFLELTL